MKTIKQCWRFISPAVLFGIGALANWFTTSQYWATVFSFFFKLFSDSVDKQLIENIRTVTGILFNVGAFLPLCFSACVRANEHRMLNTFRASCFRQIRENLAIMYTGAKGVANDVRASDLSVRLFREKRGYLSFTDIEGCYSNQIRSGIKFKISDNEGLVSKAYHSRLPEYEIENAAKSDYHLTPLNTSMVGQLKFIIAVPIIVENKVKAVITVDSERRICKNNSDISSVLKSTQVLAYDLYSLINGED